jgi:hypothetical protein
VDKPVRPAAAERGVEDSSQRTQPLAPTKFGIGQAVTRKEDDPLIRGRGRYWPTTRRPACCTDAVARAARHARLAAGAGARRAAGLAQYPGQYRIDLQLREAARDTL